MYTDRGSIRTNRNERYIIYCYMVNQLHVHKSGKHYLRFNELRGYCMGRDPILKILQSEKHKLRNGKFERGHPVVYIRFV